METDDKLTKMEELLLFTKLSSCRKHSTPKAWTWAWTDVLKRPRTGRSPAGRGPTWAARTARTRRPMMARPRCSSSRAQSRPPLQRQRAPERRRRRPWSIASPSLRFSPPAHHGRTFSWLYPRTRRACPWARRAWAPRPSPACTPVPPPADLTPGWRRRPEAEATAGGNRRRGRSRSSTAARGCCAWPATRTRAYWTRRPRAPWAPRAARTAAGCLGTSAPAAAARFALHQKISSDSERDFFFLATQTPQWSSVSGSYVAECNVPALEDRRRRDRPPAMIGCSFAGVSEPPCRHRAGAAVRARRCCCVSDGSEQRVS